MELAVVAVQPEPAVHFDQEAFDFLGLAEGVGGRHEPHPQSLGVRPTQESLVGRPAGVERPTAVKDRGGAGPVQAVGGGASRPTMASWAGA